MNIQTKRLLIVPCTEELVAELLKDEYEVGPHIEFHLKELKKEPGLFGWGVWFVAEKETNKLVGDIGFKGKPDSNKTVEIGYGILPSAQNKGYATEAVRGLIHWAFSTNEVHKIIAECLKDNLPSIKVLEKCNMSLTSEDETMFYWTLPKEKMV